MSFTTVIESSAADTNILIYSIDATRGEKHSRAKDLSQALASRGGLCMLQALNEFFSVCVRKRLIPVAAAEAFVLDQMRSMLVITPSAEDLIHAMRLSQRDGLQFFDALLIATARRSGCTRFFSEDLQHGRKFGSMEIVNPFALDEASFQATLTS